MAVCTLPSTDRLNQLFRYNEKTGEIWHRARRPEEFTSERAWRLWSVRYVNRIATSNHKAGYLTVRVGPRNHLAHRVAYKIWFGVEPPSVLDHINGDKADNRIANIRPASKVTNGFNRGPDRDSRTGYKNVTYVRRANRYTSCFTAHGVRYYVGCFRTAEEAYEAYVAKAKKIHGEFFKPHRPEPPAECPKG